MKKVITRVTTVALVTLLFMTAVVPLSASAANYNFTDISGHWARNAINYVVNTKEVMSGTSSTTFSPNANIRRCDVVVTLANVRHLQVSNNVASGFADVPSGQYYTGAVRWAKLAGIVSGTGGNNFSPQSSVTRQDLAVMVYKFGNHYPSYEFPNLYPSKSYASFSDSSSISSYARQAVTTLLRAGVLSGDGGKFRPKDAITRAEVAALLQVFYTKANGDYVTAGKKEEVLEEDYVMSITEGLLLNTFTIHGKYTEKYYLDADSAIYNDRYVYGAMKQHNLGVADIVYEYFLPTHVSASSWHEPSGGTISPGGFNYVMGLESTARASYSQRNSNSARFRLTISAKGAINPYYHNFILNFDVPPYKD